MYNNDEEEKEDGEDIKVILVGEPGTGKTSLISVSVGEEFKEITNSTLLSNFVSKKFNKNGKNYILNIWDTAGQEKYHAVTKIFTKNAQIVIFVYAINSKKTMEGLQTYWFKSIKDVLGEEPIFGLVGNKYDLFMFEEVKEEEAKEYAQQNDMQFELTSAKEDAEGFIKFLSQLLDEYIEKKELGTKRQTIFINKDDNRDKKKRKCCK